MEFRQKIIMKAIEDGWSVKKKKNTYVFTRQHYNLKEYFDSYYIIEFIKKYS